MRCDVVLDWSEIHDHVESVIYYRWDHNVRGGIQPPEPGCAFTFCAVPLDDRFSMSFWH
jgi:hypothetical protein